MNFSLIFFEAGDLVEALMVGVHAYGTGISNSLCKEGCDGIRFNKILAGTQSDLKGIEIANSELSEAYRVSINGCAAAAK